MNIYKAFYKNKEIEVQSDTSYHAQLKATELLKAKHSYDVTVVLVAINDKEVVHTPTD